MMKFTKTIRQLICPLLAALIFCSCGTVTTVQTTNTSESASTSSTTAVLSSCTTDHLKNTSTESSEATEETTTTPPILTHVDDKVIDTMKEDSNQGNIRYCLSIYSLSIITHSIPRVFAITGFRSNEEHVTIQHSLEGYDTSNLRQLDLTDYIHIPNAKILTIAEGFKNIFFAESTHKLENIEIIEFPSTTDFIGGNRGKYGNKNFTNRFPLELTMLKEIYVDPKCEYYVSIDGVLYETWINYVYEAYEQRLFAIPQNYSTDDQIFQLADGTDEIGAGAIYHCRNLKKVIIPDTVKKIEDHAIIATAEHPLTVVCSRKSVAAEYVERFGQMYHLTVEYAD